MTMSVAATHHSYYSRSGQAAGSIAEGALNSAVSVLFNASDPTNAANVPRTTVPVTGGTATYWGTLSGLTWTLVGQGQVASPTGGAPILRTATVKAALVTRYDTRIYSYLYADSVISCTTIRNNAVITAALYTRGNLCVSNNAHITGSPLQVEGVTTVGNNGSIGYAAQPLPVAKLGRGCGIPVHGCGPSDRVYVTNLTATPDGLTKPPVDLAGWYANANPGPFHPCTSGSVPGGFDNDAARNRSRGVFDLMPASRYDCQASDAGGNVVGRLAWAPGAGGNPGSLLIAGTVFFDGNISIGGNAVYQGLGTIYASGTVTMNNNAKLCAIAACDASWDTAHNVLMLVAGAAGPGVGFLMSNNSVYQGAAYVVADYLLRNNAVNWGPVVANRIDITNNAGQTVPLSGVPSGAPAVSSRSLQIVSSSYGT
jgi:hypothetical protein